MSVEVLLKGVTPTLGEGPHWDDKTQSLLFVDILSHTVYKWDSNSSKMESKTLDSNRASLIIPRESGGYVVSSSNRVETLDWDTGKTEVLGVLDNADTHVLNDGKCDAVGRLWAGTVGKNPIAKKEDAAVGIGNLYLLDNKGVISLKKDKLTIANGLTWTNDNKTMFYIDSYASKVWSYDFDLASGVIKNEQVCIDFDDPDSADYLGVPDGMTIDTEDKIWVACFGGGRVVRFDPENGKVLQTVDFPAKRITSCCFGGPNLDELYVTSSQFSMNDDEPQEFGGSVFRVTGLGVKGLPANVFKG